MRLPWLAGCAIIAMLPLLWLPVLPGPCSLAGASALALALIRLHGRAVAGVAMTLLLVVWGVLSAHQALWPTRHLTGAIRQAEVILSETDGQTLHRGQMVRLRGRYLFPPVGVTLYGELAPAPACAGQHWLMTLRLRPVHGQLNDGGFDSQRYALAQHRPLSGGIVAASALDARCSLRARYLTSLTRRLQTYPWRAVMLGLGMGERLSLPTEIKVLMQNTGTSHLMAISGLHIALAASLIMLLLRGVQYILPGRWIGWRRRLCLADRYAAAGPAHLLRACGLLCFTFVGSTLDGVAGVALLSGSDTGCRPAGGPVAKPVAICLRRGGADLLVPVAPVACRPLALAVEDHNCSCSFAGWRDAAAAAAAVVAIPWHKPDVDGG